VKAQPPLVLILMGVAGAGKTTVGRALAAALGWSFHDGDDFHSAENVARMSAGIPLTDADREPWLAAMNTFARREVAAGRSLVLASSALRQSYRDRLGEGLPTRFTYLKADPDTLARRLRGRTDHFMKDAMLASQLATLEEPADALTVDADQPVDDIVAAVLTALDLRLPGQLSPTAP
jgi:gluconokinase